MSKIKCDHCGLEYPDDLMIKDNIDGEEKNFCCNGCQGVYHLLHSEGLDSFYDKKGQTTLDIPEDKKDDLTRFDLESFESKYIIKNGNISEISLVLEGIHCAACVWLNEKVLYRTEGIIEANINFTTHKAKIKFDHSKLKLSKIIETIRAIGYNAYPYDPASGEERANKERKDYALRLVTAIALSMNVMWIAITRYFGYFGSGMDADIEYMMKVAEFVLVTPVLFYSGYIYFRGAYYGIRNKIINMDFLISFGATIAYVYSIYATFIANKDPYFDSVGMIITFVLIGKFLEVKSKKMAIDSVDSMVSSLPQEVLVVENGEKRSKNIEEINSGDIIELRAGDKIAFDGVIKSGSANIDTSSITGENLPVVAKEGDEIISGSINLDGTLLMEVSKDYKSSTLYSIISLLEDSMSKKPKIEQLANRISEYFSVTILTLSFVTFFYWYLSKGEFEFSLITAISVVVIACPCALALATPIATLVGLGSAMKKGIMFKTTQYIETLAKADTIILDKTGTITKGTPEVVSVKWHKKGFSNVILSLVQHSKHPISKGVEEYLLNLDSSNKYINIENIKTVPAKGINADSETGKLYGGNAALMSDIGIDINSENRDNIVFYFAINNELIATFELEDEIKKDTKDVIVKLKKLGLDIKMATGDHANSANKVAKAVGIDDVYSELLPADKAKLVDNIHKDKKVVVMVGDGINDSIALAKADIAVAMHSGADVAIDVSDIIILNSSLTNLYDAFRISKRTYYFVKENLTISLIYNSITVPLAMMGYIIPLIAAIAMSFSSILVVLNSLRIKR